MPTIPTFREVVMEHHQKADGTYNVKIRVTHHREVRYIPTSVTVEKHEITRKMKIKSQAKLDILETFKRQLRDAVSSANIFEIDAMTVDEVISFVQAQLLQSKAFRLEFFEYGRKIAAEKPKHSRRNYETALRDFSAFAERDNMDISEITSSMLRRYEQSIKKRLGKQARAVSLYTSSIAHIHRRAREEFNNEELNQIRIKNPYEYYKVPTQEDSDPRSVEMSVIHKMVETRLELTGRKRFAVDMYLLSFCLMGMNVPDLYEAGPAVDNVLTYYRHKTRSRRKDKAEAHVRMEEWALNLAKPYRSSDKNHAFRFFTMYCRYETMRDAIGKGLEAWREEYKQPYFTDYSARHTWATTAYAAGVNPAHITDGLVHRDPSRRMDDKYVRKAWELLWDQNRKVLEYAFGDNKFA